VGVVHGAVERVDDPGGRVGDQVRLGCAGAVGLFADEAAWLVLHLKKMEGVAWGSMSVRRTAPRCSAVHAGSRDLGRGFVFGKDARHRREAEEAKK